MNKKEQDDKIGNLESKVKDMRGWVCYAFLIGTYIGLMSFRVVEQIILKYIK
jgi:hypothetical protein